MTSLRVHGHELLADARAERPDAAIWFHGSFPLAPWAGTPIVPVLQPAGIDLASPSDPSGSHGTVVRRDWRIVGTPTPDSLEIETSLGASWPWTGIARQRFLLDDGGLRMELEVEAGEAFPVTLGFHPWFRTEIEELGEAVLEFLPGARWVLDSDGVGSPSPDLGAPPRNDIYLDVAADPTITWGGELRLRLSSDARFWVVFEPMSAGFCVEPWTDTPDRFARGSVAPLAPGATERLVCSLRWSD